MDIDDPTIQDEPLLRDEPLRIPTAADAPQVASARKVLVMDDDLELAMTLKELIDEATELGEIIYNVRVLIAENAPDAIRQLTDANGAFIGVDAALLDLMQPGAKEGEALPSLQLAKKLMEHGTSPDNVILHSGSAEDIVRKEQAFAGTSLKTIRKGNSELREKIISFLNAALENKLPAGGEFSFLDDYDYDGISDIGEITPNARVLH